MLKSSPQPHIFLQIGADQVWTLRATVEHQLVWIGLDSPGKVVIGPDVRFTLVQEVRFSAPDAFIAALQAVAPPSGVNTLEPSVATPARNNPQFQEGTVRSDRLTVVARGYFGGTMIQRLIGDGGALVDQNKKPLSDLMLIEASVPAYLATWKLDQAAPPSNLTYLPGGTTLGRLSVLTDFQTPPKPALAAAARPKGLDAGADHTPWLLLPLPFLGRCQPRDQDKPNTTAGRTGPKFAAPAANSVRVDPVLQIQQAQAAGVSPINRLTLTLANREDGTAVSVGLAEFDLARTRQFARLDPSSLRESWFRLSLAPPQAAASGDGDLASVLADPPTDDPGTLGRPESLDRVYDPFRFALPPKASPDLKRSTVKPPPSGFSAPIHWEPDSLFLIDTGRSGFTGSPRSETVLGEFGFLGPGFMLQQSGIVPHDSALAQSAEASYRAGASLMPARRRTDLDRGPNPQPVSLAVSPYLGIGFVDADVPPAETDEWQLGLSELVVFDTTGNATVSLATRFWYPPKFPAGKPSTYALIRAGRGRCLEPVRGGLARGGHPATRDLRHEGRLRHDRQLPLPVA